MKEFLSNNLELFLFNNNEEEYYALKSRLEEFVSRPDFILLQDSFQIFTREKITSDYLALRLVKDGIPSLSFRIVPYRVGLREFIEIEEESFISDFSCRLILENILQEEKGDILSKRAVREIASDLLKTWKELILAGHTDKSKVGKNKIKPEYEKTLKKFITRKKQKYTIPELLSNAVTSQKVLSGEKIRSSFGKELYLYGISEIDNIYIELLKLLSDRISIKFLLTSPLIQSVFSEKELSGKKIEEVLPSTHVLAKLLGDKKAAELISGEDTGRENTKYIFREAREVYREIECVGRDIFKIIRENEKNPAFSLPSIKIILPDDSSYIALLNNIFKSIGIPVSYTRDISRKLSPYYSAVSSLLKLISSDFDKETAFSLFYNPCFFPMPDGKNRVEIIPELWNRILSGMNVSGFLDEAHRKEEGFPASSVMTWESLWNRLNRAFLGVSGVNDYVPENDLKEEGLKFLHITSSLLHDLIGFKYDFKYPHEYARFFRIITEIYLSPEMRTHTEDHLFSLNTRVQKKIYSILSELEDSGKEFKDLKYSVPPITGAEFAEILLDALNDWSEGSHGILKQGVTVGTFRDTADPSFKYIFVLGMDENRYSPAGSNRDYLTEEEYSSTNKNDSVLKSLYNLPHIAHYNPETVTISYVSMDTIKDNVHYPAPELKMFAKSRGVKISEFAKIPLFSFLEQDSDLKENLLWEDNAVRLFEIKRREAINPEIKNLIPGWESGLSKTDSPDLLNRIVSRENTNLINSIKNYFYRPHTKEFSEVRTLHITASRLASYLVCPKKFFYEYAVRTEEEEEITGEVDSISAFHRHVILKEILTYLLFENNLTPDKILKKVFNKTKQEEGIIPFGILGTIEYDTYRNYIEQELVPFKQSLTEEGYRILPSLLGKTEPGTYYDFLLGRENNLFPISITTSSALKPKTLFTSLFNSFILQKDELILQESKEIYSVKEPFFKPAVFHFPAGDTANFYLLETPESTPDFYDQFLEHLNRNFFPASPILQNDKNKTPCSFCPINRVCLGVKSNYEPFDEIENGTTSRDNFIETLKTQKILPVKKN